MHTLRDNISGNNKKSLWSRGIHIPIVLLLPALIILVLIVAFPMLYSLYISFTDFTLLNPNTFSFIGFKNYIDLFQDKIFLQSLWRTILYIALAVNLEFILGLFIAHVISHVVRGQSIIRTLLMIPMMFAPVLIGFQFRWIFNDQVGLINNILYEIFNRPIIIPWLIDKPFGFIAILIAEIWMSTPFMIIILLAGILSISSEVLEAAEVDGANEWHKLRYVILPSITPFIYIAMAIRSLDISKAYDLISIMTGGGPAHRTELIWTYVFRLSFTSQKFAMGSAMSYVTVILAFLFTFYFFKQLIKARVGN